MRLSVPRRAVRAAVVTLALLPALLTVLPPSSSQASPEEGQLPGKKFAAYEFGWYPIGFVDHFLGGPRPAGNWEREEPAGGRVGLQNGMLTLQSEGDGTVGATLRGESHTEGRWEIRLRGRRYEAQHTDYTVAAELVPAPGYSYDCGARTITLTRFAPASQRISFGARNLPDLSFGRQLRFGVPNDFWRTYGVEVTPNRISWFVDGAVVATERRDEAISGVPLDFRLQLQAVDGATMNESRLQVDTVRYFTLQNPNDLPVRAPRTRLRTYEGACPSGR